MSVVAYSMAPRDVPVRDREGSLSPFEPTELSERAYRVISGDDRVVRLEFYNATYLERLDYDGLQRHGEMRRSHTDEDIDLSQSEPDLRERLRIDREG